MEHVTGNAPGGTFPIPSRPALVEHGNPLPGDPAVWTVPGAVEWELELVAFTLVTAVAVADRFAVVDLLGPDGAVFATVGAPFKQTASHTSSYTFGAGMSEYGADNAARIGAGFPPVRLVAGLGIQLTAVGIQAADQIERPALYVRQWPNRE